MSVKVQGANTKVYLTLTIEPAHLCAASTPTAWPWALLQSPGMADLAGIAASPSITFNIAPSMIPHTQLEEIEYQGWFAMEE